MFNRRRAASNPAQKQPPPNASASLAATKAFMKNRESNGSLSSAAAAAALRTHTTSPTPVGDTITKRMVRKGSTSSHGSGSQQPPNLRRQSSSGSMTERSFRAPSPSRGSAHVDQHHDAPPVPSVPKNVPTASAVHRRASSLEPPYRVGSPVGRGGGRGSSLDRGSAANPVRTQTPASRVTSLSQVPEDEGDGSPRLVNFSRPISPPQAMSPSRPEKPIASGRGGYGGWHGGPVVNTEGTFRGTPKPRPQTSDGLGGFAAHSAQQSVQNAATRPVSTHKNIAHGVEGARLASGSMRAKPSGSSVQSQVVSQEPRQSVNPNSPNAVYDPSTRSFIHKQAAMQKFREMSEHTEGTSQLYPVQHAQPAQPRHTAQQFTQERTPSPRHNQRHSSPPRRTVNFAQHEEQPVTPDHHAHEEHEEHEEHWEEQRTATPQPRLQPGAVLARQTSEDFAGGDIRPQADVQTTSALEPVLPEPSAEAAPDPASPRLAQNQDGAYPRLSAPAKPATVHSLVGERHGSIRSERTQSLSPPRNAHFAQVAVEFPNGVIHQPPPRSVSPAKSALKASPSVSRRNSSPIANNGRTTSRTAPSETSDTMSDSGSKKKKRTVRVSFDEEAVIAGTSAYAEAETPTSPTGLGQSRWSPANQEQGMDDVMKPRPALPSFGSVRGKDRRQDESDTLEKVTETVSSSMSTSVGSIRDSQEASSDIAIGGILAQDFATKKDPQDPLPPEVTSVEGTGYVSDTDSSSDGGAYDDIVAQHLQRTSTADRDASIAQLEPKTLTTPTETPATISVPAIAIQPASPSPRFETAEPRFEPFSDVKSDPVTAPEPEIKPAPKAPRPFVPGGWDDDEEADESAVISNNTKSAAAPQAPKPIGRYSGITNREKYPVAIPEDLDTSDDDSSSSSIYSDAYEELTDAENGGFASIDAVVESPIVAPTTGLMFSKYASQKSTEPVGSDLRNEVATDQKEDKQHVQHSADDWEATRQHWNGVNETRKKQEQKERTPVTSVETSKPAAPVPSAVAQAAGQPPIKTPAAKPRAEPNSKPAQPAPISKPAPSSAQPRKSALKKTTPVAAPPQASSAPQIRKTMRGSTGPTATASPTQAAGSHMRMSMRNNDPVTPRGSSGLAASRHSMPPPPKGALQKKHIPATAVVPKARPQSAAAAITSRPIASKPSAPAPKYDSDSDASASSFQRQRPRASRGGEGRYSMRGSMRGNPGPSMRDGPSMRPMSPVEKPSSPPPAFRKSMRPSSPTPEASTAPGLKSSKFSIRSLSPAGRFRSKKTTAVDAPPMPVQTASPKRGFGKSKQKPVAAPASKSRYKSRFADSSDEDEDDRPRRFQSRFADSDEDSDYELPPGLAPVRGIPKKAGDEDRDSTDLEEELSDVEPSSAKTTKDIEKISGPVTNGHTNGQGTTLASGSLRKSKHAPELPTFDGGKKAKTKRGFFGLGKKKPAAPVQAETATVPSNGISDIPFPPEHRNRPLTPIGEDEDKALEASPIPRSPKLQRRTTPQYNRSVSDSWPLPQPPTIGEESRPQSSDGVIPRRTSLRPTLSKRHSSTVSEARTAIDPKSGKEVVIGRTGKKKKFQGLRRVFGLND